MFNNLIFLLQTTYNVAFCQSVEELYPPLKNRYPLPAFLYSADNIESLQHMAHITQNRICDCNSNENNVIHQIALPTVITKTVCLKNNETDDVEETALMAYQQSGEWAVSGLNGFCTAASDEELCQILAGKTMAYPMAQWFPFSHNEVVAFARNNYVKRFYSRYWHTAEQTFLPQEWIEEFVDQFFEQREERRKSAQYEDYKKLQAVRGDMGWY